jgi:hypothetical protein
MSSNNIQVPLSNYTMPVNDSQHLTRPGVVFKQGNLKEDIQNKKLFEYRMPKIENPPCLSVDMRPQETRHNLLGTNVCDVLRNTYVNPETHASLSSPIATNQCSIDPYLGSWNKYTRSINLESDMKNIIRKISCDENSVYMPSTNSVMYSKAPMQKDSTLESGYIAIKTQEATTGRVSNFFMEDTRQTRMGK